MVRKTTVRLTASNDGIVYKVARVIAFIGLWSFHSNIAADTVKIMTKGKHISYANRLIKKQNAESQKDLDKERRVFFVCSGMERTNNHKLRV